MCSACRKLGKWRSLTVKEGRIVASKHPEDDHHANCEPISQSVIDALDVDRTMRSNARTTGKRARESYNEAVCSIAKRCKTSDEQTAVIVNFPSYGEVRRQLNRHRTFQHVPVPDPLNIPAVMRMTWRGRQLPETDENHAEQFLLYESENGRMLIFCAKTELKLLHQSEYVICDGTFEMAPDSAYQLYTMHGFFNGESIPLLWALLPGKTNALYREMFSAIRQSMMTEYNSIGAIKYVLTDFEIAAIQAVETIFPEVTVKGCSFHFRQAIIRRINEEGKSNTRRLENTNGNF